MIEDAEKAGRLTPQTHIIEPTSGNTGIALAFVCAAKGYRLTLNDARIDVGRASGAVACAGANLVLTPAAEGMRGAIAKASELVANDSAGWMPQQFENPPIQRSTNERPVPKFGMMRVEKLMRLLPEWGQGERLPEWLAISRS